MKFTGKEIMDAFLLFLDDALPEFECKKIEIEGNPIVTDVIYV